MRFLVTMLFCLPLCAQQAQDAPRPQGQRQPPKNLKILKPEEVGTAMRSFRTGLGVECTFCHIRGDFASDENPNKNTARMMLTMMREVNAKFTDGKDHVTCYTCHRGEQEPKMAPPAATGPGQPQ